MMVMFRWLKFSAQLLLVFFAGVALANAVPADTNEDSTAFKPALSCSMAKAYDSDRHPVYFFQHKFPDESQDLAIAKPLAGGAFDIKRVTFGGADTTECRYKDLAIARGGNWGWHLLWLAEGGAIMHYARMDGEAWVSSPTKKLSDNAHPATPPIILTLEQKVWVVWHEAGSKTNKIYAVFSADEGRNWNEVKLIAEAANPLGDFQLLVKDNKPYLVGRGVAESLPLQIW